MAVTTVTSGLNQEKGITYSVITDSSADWASVANSTYFYDLGDGLPHYKDGSGTVLELFSSSSDSIYTASGTVPTSVVATLTDTIKFEGGTLIVEGADTLSTSTAFEIYDGDTVPSSLWDFRNNGDVVVGKDSTWTLGTKTLTFDGTGETGNVSVKILGGNNHNAFQVRGLSDSDFFDLYSAGTSTLTMRGISTFKGANTAAGTSILKMIDSASSSKFDVRCNGDIYTNGTQGLSATYTFGGVLSGDIASMTFTNGLLTAVTTVL